MAFPDSSEYFAESIVSGTGGDLEIPSTIEATPVKSPRNPRRAWAYIGCGFIIAIATALMARVFVTPPKPRSPTQAITVAKLKVPKPPRTSVLAPREATTAKLAESAATAKIARPAPVAPPKTVVPAAVVPDESLKAKSTRADFDDVNATLDLAARRLGVLPGDLMALDQNRFDAIQFARDRRFDEAMRALDKGFEALRNFEIDNAFVAAKLQRYYHKIDQLQNSDRRAIASNYVSKIGDALNRGRARRANSTLNQAIRELRLNR